MTPPPHSYIPEGPIEAAPYLGFCPPEMRQEAFGVVLEGVETGAYDRRIVAWLTQGDDPTCRTIASLLWRCRLAGAAAPGSRMTTADWDERDYATAAYEPGDYDGLIEDDDTYTCSTCGAWIGMLIGHTGWQHYRGRPPEIYDAGHEATIAPRAGRGGTVNRQERSAPGTVGLRLAGSPEDTGTLISVLERLAAGLPVTTVRLEILHRSGGRVNRRDPGEHTYMLVRVGAPGMGASGAGSAP